MTQQESNLAEIHRLRRELDIFKRRWRESEAIATHLGAELDALRKHVAANARMWVDDEAIRRASQALEDCKRYMQQKP